MINGDHRVDAHRRVMILRMGHWYVSAYLKILQVLNLAPSGGRGMGAQAQKAPTVCDTSTNS